MSHVRTITLVHMGDSITFGQYVDQRLCWTTLIAERLTQHHRNALQILSVNRGVSGETTRMGLERFPADVQSHAPQILTLQFGLNDCNCWQTDNGLPRVSEAAFKANLIEMISRAQRFGAQRIILANNHRTLRRAALPSGEAYEDANARYSRIIRAVADETGVIFCDIRQAFDPYPDDKLEQLLLPYPDHLHLSVEGNRIYADVMWPFVKGSVADVVENTRSAAATT